MERRKQTKTFSKVTEVGTAECVVEISTSCDATLWRTSVVVQYPSSRKRSRALVPVDRPTAWGGVVVVVGAVVLDRDEDDKRVGRVPSQPSKRKSAPMVYLVVHVVGRRSCRWGTSFVLCSPFPKTIESVIDGNETLWGVDGKKKP